MGKFGSRKFPKFIKSETEVYGANPKSHSTGLKRLKSLGLAEPQKPKVLEVYGNSPQDLAAVRAAGFKVNRLAGSHFLKIQTVWGDEAILNFELDTEYTDWEDGMGSADLVGEHEGFEYRIQVEVSKFGGDVEVDEIDEDTIEAKDLGAGDSALSSTAVYNKTPIQIDREKRNDPNYAERVVAQLIKEWEDGPKDPIKINAYRDTFKISNPIEQVDPKTGDITTDDGQQIELNDVGGFQISKWTSRERGIAINTVYSATGLAFHAYGGKLAEGRAIDSFDSFVNECWSPRRTRGICSIDRPCSM